MKRPLFIAIFAITVLFFGRPVPGYSAAPWQWLLCLKGQPSGHSISLPSALYIDQALGRYYVVDAGNNRLLSYTKDGEFLRSFDVDGRLQAPFDMVRDQETRIWLVEKGRNSLTMIDLRNKLVEHHSLSDNGRTVSPDRLEWEDGVFFLLDRATGQVLSLDQDLEVTGRFASKDSSNGFVDFKIRNGSLWALERGGKAVLRFNMDGQPASSVALDDVLRFPCSLEVGPSGVFYVLDRHGGDIAVFDQKGRFKYRFLHPGHTRGRLYFPIELKFDPWGRLCVVEEGNGRVEVFSR
ncbi:MAG: hypothetical protein BA864_10690 [Desulfuromonadales bacterium C00003093]|nr:MAG: hypothetical protein BA864_10690 [Desulfuromonadales bacterium C00003093]